MYNPNHMHISLYFPSHFYKTLVTTGIYSERVSTDLTRPRDTCHTSPLFSPPGIQLWIQSQGRRRMHRAGDSKLLHLYTNKHPCNKKKGIYFCLGSWQKRVMGCVDSPSLTEIHIMKRGVYCVHPRHSSWWIYYLTIKKERTKQWAKQSKRGRDGVEEEGGGNVLGLTVL